LGDFWALAEKYGLPIAMLCLAVVALYYDWVVSGRRFRTVQRERDQLLRLALTSTSVGERSARVAERVVGALVRQKDESDDDGPTA
jgi:hypothetical protein